MIRRMAAGDQRAREIASGGRPVRSSCGEGSERGKNIMGESISSVVYAAGFVVGSLVRGYYTRRTRRRVRKWAESEPVDRILLTLASVGMLLPIIFLAAPWLDFADYDLPLWVDRLTAAAGGVLFAAAVILLWRSHADLGRNWSWTVEIHENHALVTTGVYRFIRHPMYAAHLLWGIAQALLIHNWVAGPAFVVAFVPLFLYRAPREERMMLERFRNEYRLYMGNTGRIVPRLRSRPPERPGGSG
jgi:protein-S-isoprenylcysteine O-methyltransferase Ste14